MSFIQAHTNPDPHTSTHRAAQGDMCVYMALLKSLVAVKLNLSIIISCKTAESHLPSHTSREIQRKGLVVLIARTVHVGLIEGIIPRCVPKRNDEARQ